MPDDHRFLPSVIRHSNALATLEGRVGGASMMRNPITGLVTRVGLRTSISTMRVQTEHARVQAGLITEAGHVIQGLDDYFDIAARSEAKRNLSAENYISKLHDEMDVLEEARHKRELALVRREKEAFEVRKEMLKAKHGVEAEEEFKDAKFAAGHARFNAKAAERGLDAAVARAAAAEPVDVQANGHEPADVELVRKLLQRKLREIDEAEADGKDTAALRELAGKLQELIAAI